MILEELHCIGAYQLKLCKCRTAMHQHYKDIVPSHITCVQPYLHDTNVHVFDKLQNRSI